MADLYGAFSRGRAAGEGRRTQRLIGQNLQPALAGDQAAQNQLYQADPSTGMQVQQLARRQQSEAKEQSAAKLRQIAGLYATAPQQVKGQLYGQIRTLTEEVGLAPAGTMPMSLDTPEDQQGFEKFIQSIAQGGASDGNNVQSRFIDDKGNMVALMRNGETRIVGKADPSMQIIEGEGGFFGVNRRGSNLQASPVQLGGQPQVPMQQDYGPAETDAYVQKIMGSVGALDPNMSPEQMAERILPHLIQQESGGNPNAVSPKGAQGLTQVMPATGQDPGFGVAPLRDNSPQENVRFGRDYLTAMLKRYPGRPDLALAAYNAGPGVADRFAGRAGQLRPAPKTISPAEERRLQLAEEAAQRAREAADRSRFGNAPAGFRFKPDGTLEAIPGGPKPAGSAATEGERKAATLLQRLNFSLGQLQTAVKENPTAASPNMTSEVLRRLPLVGEVAANAATPAERQRVESAQLDILDAALTLGTGAAYTREQLEGYRRAYFPQIGDSPTAIRDKAARLQNVIEAAKIAAGRAAPAKPASPKASDDDALINKYLRR